MVKKIELKLTLFSFLTQSSNLAFIFENMLRQTNQCSLAAAGQLKLQYASYARSWNKTGRASEASRQWLQQTNLWSKKSIFLESFQHHLFRSALGSRKQKSKLKNNFFWRFDSNLNLDQLQCITNVVLRKISQQQKNQFFYFFSMPSFLQYFRE